MIQVFRKDEEGVSPVIGVILMVAITVILAAVIAAFVFGLGGNVKTKKTPAISVKRDAPNIVELTLQDKGGANNITSVTVTSPSGATVQGTDPTADGWDVGETVTYSGVPPGSHLIITASLDGETQVILDTTV